MPQIHLIWNIFVEAELSQADSAWPGRGRGREISQHKGIVNRAPLAKKFMLSIVIIITKKASKKRLLLEWEVLRDLVVSKVTRQHLPPLYAGFLLALGKYVQTQIYGANLVTHLMMAFIVTDKRICLTHL